MKKVSAFQTSDGKTFTDEIEALRNEQRIELRGIVQSTIEIPHTNSVPIGTLLDLLEKGGSGINAILKKYRQKIDGAKMRLAAAATLK
jgi:hypothetical protein